MNKSEREITRRDFLKLTGLGFGLFAFRKLEYHYPGYSDAHVTLPDDFFNSQIKYLVDGGYRTVSDKEFKLFLAITR